MALIKLFIHSEQTAIIKRISDCSIEIYQDEDGEKYSDSFMKLYDDIKSDLAQCESREEHDEMINTIINDYNLPVFSHAWATAFLYRNHLSWRNAHYSRHGSVDPTYSKIYINQVC